MTGPIEEEQLLDRFRLWLHDAREEADSWNDDDSSAEPERDEVGLYRLVEEFTALRQEVKLQTKSGRGLQEQVEAVLPTLRSAIDAFQLAPPRDEQSWWTVGKPLAEALADLDEALDRGWAEIDKASRRLVDEASLKLQTALDELLARQSWFGRRRHRAYHALVQEVARQHGPEAGRDFFDALKEGYGLIQSRLRRVMKAERLERVETVGRPVDPDRMTVLEVVEDSGQPPGHVVEEVRKGYVWRSRVLRYAEVRAARSAAIPEDDEPIESEPIAIED